MQDFLVSVAYHMLDKVKWENQSHSRIEMRVIGAVNLNALINVLSVSERGKSAVQKWTTVCRQMLDDDMYWNEKI